MGKDLARAAWMAMRSLSSWSKISRRPQEQSLHAFLVRFTSQSGFWMVCLRLRSSGVRREDSSMVGVEGAVAAGEVAQREALRAPPLAEGRFNRRGTEAGAGAGLVAVSCRK